MNKKKMVVWDLFGGGQNSVPAGLLSGENQDNYIVHTFDVVPTEMNDFKHKNYIYHELDLAAGMIKIDGKKHKVNGSTDIVKIFKSLNLPHPDIIVSSTLCQSFSNVLSMVGGGTCFWKKESEGKLEDNVKLVEREVEEFEKLKSGFTKKLSWEKQLFIKRLGEQTVLNSIKLIKHFKPKYWYIENPSSSLIWYYIRNNVGLKGYINKTTLGDYGYPIAKHAGFYSNVEMNLKNGNFAPDFKKVKFNGEDVFLLSKFTLKDLKEKFDSKESNFVYATKGMAYKDEKDKKLIRNNFYTYWKPISKSAYDAINERVEAQIKRGSKGDKRETKKVDDKYFRRYYVEHGYGIEDKGHHSLKKTTVTLGKMSGKIYKQDPGMTTIQLAEASKSSHIPSGLIIDIFSNFK